jgi:hypothetical protein
LLEEGGWRRFEIVPAERGRDRLGQSPQLGIVEGLVFPTPSPPGSTPLAHDVGPYRLLDWAVASRIGDDPG